MTLVVGIDPSSKKIAAVALQTGTGTFKTAAKTLYPKGDTKQTPASLHNAMSFMRDFTEGVAHMAPEGQRFAYVEAPLVGRGGAGATIKQAYVGGIIRAWLVEAGFTVYDAPLTSWRSGYLGVRAGKGRTTAILKIETKAVVALRWPKIMPGIARDGDLIDAAGICLYGQDQVRKAGLIISPGSAGGVVRGGGSSVVVRASRVRSRMRRD